jgi:hypothetical protein
MPETPGPGPVQPPVKSAKPQTITPKKQFPQPPKKKVQMSLEVQVSRLSRLLTHTETDIREIEVRTSEVEGTLNTCKGLFVADVDKIKLLRIQELLTEIQTICGYYAIQE